MKLYLWICLCCHNLWSARCSCSQFTLHLARTRTPNARTRCVVPEQGIAVVWNVRRTVSLCAALSSREIMNSGRARIAEQHGNHCRPPAKGEHSKAFSENKYFYLKQTKIIAPIRFGPMHVAACVCACVCMKRQWFLALENWALFKHISNSK